EFVWQPIAEIELAEVVAIGADWQRVAQRLALPEKPLDVQFTDRTRRARAFALPSGQRLAVTWHQASNSPPNTLDARALKRALRAAIARHPNPGTVGHARAGLAHPGEPPPRQHPCAPFWAQLRARLERERPTWRLGSPNR